jgi:hypothetical protein
MIDLMAMRNKVIPIYRAALGKKPHEAQRAADRFFYAFAQWKIANWKAMAERDRARGK